MKITVSKVISGVFLFVYLILKILGVELKLDFILLTIPILIMMFEKNNHQIKVSDSSNLKNKQKYYFIVTAIIMFILFFFIFKK
ncbi:MAG TPA: hypothetical protein EYG89_00870 [Bacteroidia bacterium]|nr:hypothetical protein [Bacteroidia bacterium]